MGVWRDRGASVHCTMSGVCSCRQVDGWPRRVGRWRTARHWRSTSIERSASARSARCLAAADGVNGPRSLVVAAARDSLLSCDRGARSKQSIIINSARQERTHHRDRSGPACNALPRAQSRCQLFKPHTFKSHHSAVCSSLSRPRMTHENHLADLPHTATDVFRRGGPS